MIDGLFLLKFSANRKGIPPLTEKYNIPWLDLLTGAVLEERDRDNPGVRVPSTKYSIL